jgi:hypothetical protein
MRRRYLSADALQRLTRRCSEPGGRVVLAILASRPPGR